MPNHDGQCHCGAIKFTVELADDALDKLITCNCSLCGRAGTYLSFVPSTDFTLKSGEDALKDYQFGKKQLHHPFCTTCGVRTHAHGLNPETGGSMTAVNVRTIGALDCKDLKPNWHDGRAT